jgi:hypothetical protein
MDHPRIPRPRRTSRARHRLGPALAALLLAPAAAAAAGPAGFDHPLAEHAQTCRHFENRARFVPRVAGAPFTVRFADSCRAALGMARLGPSAPEAALDVPAEVRAARRYLDRLTTLRLEVARMNRARLYGAGADRLARPRQGAGFRTVTLTGEYLIARRIGAVQALDRWTRATMRLAGAAAAD